MFRGAPGSRRMTERGFRGSRKEFRAQWATKGRRNSPHRAVRPPPGPSPHAQRGLGPPRAAAPLWSRGQGTWGGGGNPNPGAPPPPTSLGAQGEGPGGGAQPLEGCGVPPCGPLGPELLPEPPKPLSGTPPISRCSPEHFRTPKPFILYINLRLRTIPETLVMSGISSGTPNNLR